MYCLPAGPEPEASLDVKASLGKLLIPEEPKVSHGDDQLSLDDFLASARQRVSNIGHT